MLRAALGTALLFQGTSYLRKPQHIAEPLCALTAFAGGVLLIIGFFTPIVAALIALAAVGISLSLPLCMPDLFNTKLADSFAIAILLAIILLGPGAFSVDARLFGRREIIIPRPPK